jgi:hypothetical protein
MKSWIDLCVEKPEVAESGKKLLLQSRAHVGLAFLATLRKDGAPRLHPVSLVLSKGHLYVGIPPTSPKCADLIRDGRYALQAYPPSKNDAGEEFYLAGCAERIQDRKIRRALIEDAKIILEEDEVLFELLLERAMYTRLVNQGTPDEHPVHKKWRSALNG